MSINLPQRKHVPQTGHKYTVGNKVRNVASWSRRYNETGAIVSLLPWGNACVYDVQYSDGVYPVAETNIDKLETTTLQADNDAPE